VNGSLGDAIRPKSLRLASYFADHDTGDRGMNVNRDRRTGHAKCGSGHLGNAWVSRSTNYRGAQRIPGSGASLSVISHGDHSCVAGLKCEFIRSRTGTESNCFTHLKRDVGARTERDSGRRNLGRELCWAAAAARRQKHTCHDQKNQRNSGKELSHETLQRGIACLFWKTPSVEADDFFSKQRAASNER
jgi:hypothetical protein